MVRKINKKKIRKNKKKKNKDTKLSPHERVALEVLNNSRRELSTSEVAKYGNMSWSTAKKSLNKLYRKRRFLHTKKKGKARMWFIEK